MRRVERGDVGDVPLHLRGPIAEALPHQGQRRLGHIQHGHAVPVLLQQLVHEGRRARPDVDQARPAAGGSMESISANDTIGRCWNQLTRSDSFVR